MISGGIRKLKGRLSDFLRLVRGGDAMPAPGRSEVVAEPRQPGNPYESSAHSELARWTRSGKVRLGAPNRADLYPQMPRFLPPGTAKRLLDEMRAEL